MILSDQEIAEAIRSQELTIDPYTEANLQPASVDVTLGDGFYISKPERIVIDPLNNLEGHGFEHVIGGRVIIQPQEFILATTIETIGITNGYVGIVNGKSSLARLGLLVHVTAGFIDPGFIGQVTLELFNVSANPIMLTVGMKIAQIVFQKLGKSAQFPYGHPSLNSKYQNQHGATLSRYHLNRGEPNTTA